jgi:hypothetical protein
LDLNLGKKLEKCCIWSIVLWGAENWTLRAADQNYLESFEMWCWRSMEKISWTDRVRNEEVLHRVKEQRNILHTVKSRKGNWIGHGSCRNCLLKHVTKGKIKLMGLRGGRPRQLLNDLKIRILENERRSTRSNTMGNLLWKRLLTCPETDYVMMMMMAK